MNDGSANGTDAESRASPPAGATMPRAARLLLGGNILSVATAWIDRIDPGTHRRIKGLRLVTAYGIGALLGTVHDLTQLTGAAAISPLAGGIALWASVSEARGTRRESSRDLALLVGFAVIGAAVMALLTPLLSRPNLPGAELLLAGGAFLVGYLKRFGILGGGIGSQIFIGQFLAYGIGLTSADLGAIIVAGVIAALAAIVPRLLSGPAEQPVLPPMVRVNDGSQQGMWSMELVMGLQAFFASLAVVALSDAFGLQESAWAIAACTYTMASSFSGTVERTRLRLIGTVIGVPLAIICLPLAGDAQPAIWAMAAAAMIIYAMALPERYDIACGAFSFALIVTLAAAGERSLWILTARIWETVIGGTLGIAAAFMLLWLRRRYPGR
jgi:hypothetical protein